MKRVFRIGLVAILALSSILTFAGCPAPAYKITYTIDGVVQEGQPSTYKISFTDDLDLWQPEVASDKVFDGWFDNANFEGVTTAKIPMETKGDKSFFGKIVQKTSAIKYFIDGDEMTDAADTYDYSSTNYQLWNPPARDNHVFQGWFTSASFAGQGYSQIPARTTGPKTYYGKYVELPAGMEVYDISYVIDGVVQENTMPSSYTALDAGAEAALWTPIFDVNEYSFDGWYTNPEFTGTKVTKLATDASGDKTYYGRYREPNGYAKGRTKLANFTLTGMEGGVTVTKSLADFYGVRPVVLNFWYKDCPNCKEEMPSFQSAYNTYGKGDVANRVEFFMINCKDSKSVTDSFLTSNGWNFPRYYAVGTSVMSNYGISGYPITIIADKWGYQTYKQSGGISHSDLTAKILAAF